MYMSKHKDNKSTSIAHQRAEVWLNFEHTWFHIPVQNVV